MLALVMATAMATMAEEVALVADDVDVPAPLLAALVWHGSRFDPDLPEGWGGFGPLGLREPVLHLAASASGLDDERVATDPAANLTAGAALLRQQALIAHGAEPADLEEWLEAVRVFSGSHDPAQQTAFVRLVRGTLADGLDERAPTGERVVIPAHDDLEPDPVEPGPDVGGGAFSPACSTWQAARGPDDITRVVVHTTQGRYAGTLDWFRRCSGVSAHYVIRASDGAVTQTVPTRDIAFHAGNRAFNAMSVGIEHEGWVRTGRRWYSEAMYRSSARLVADLVLRTAVEPDREHIVAHAEVPGARHGDPGRAWDWDRYLGYVRDEVERTELVIEVRGRVLASDAWNGEPVADAIVWLDDLEEPVVTDASGEFAFVGLPPGAWTASAVAVGHREASCTVQAERLGAAWCTIVVDPEGEPSPTRPKAGATVLHADPPVGPWALVAGAPWVLGRRRGRLR